LANFAAAVFRDSLALAAICSVSSVMKFSSTHEAREAFTPRPKSCCSAPSMNFLASSALGAAEFVWAFAPMAASDSNIATHDMTTAICFQTDFIGTSLSDLSVQR
jgi:hypothetical protein